MRYYIVWEDLDTKQIVTTVDSMKQAEDFINRQADVSLGFRLKKVIEGNELEVEEVERIIEYKLGGIKI